MISQGRSSPPYAALKQLPRMSKHSTTRTAVVTGRNSAAPFGRGGSSNRSDPVDLRGTRVRLRTELSAFSAARFRSRGGLGRLAIHRGGAAVYWPLAHARSK